MSSLDVLGYVLAIYTYTKVSKPIDKLTNNERDTS